MRRGQFFIISAVLIAGALLTITTIITASENVDFNAVLERHDTAVVENVARIGEAEWWDGDWDRRKTVTVEETAGAFLENESVPIVLDAVDSRLNDTCAGIRVLQDGERRPWINTTSCDIDTYDSDAVDADARYKLDEGSGTTANDSTGNGNDGTLQDDAQWVSGRFGNGLLFDGSDDYVDTGTHIDTSNAVTLTAWARVEGSPGTWRTVGMQRQGSGMNRGWNIYASDSDTWEFWVGSGGDGTDDWTVVGRDNVSDVREGEWTHVALVAVNGSYIEGYVDGKLLGRLENSGIWTDGNSESFTFGGAGGGGFHFDGVLDDVRVYPTALSPGRIAGIARNGVGLNVSLDLAPRERTSEVQVYYESFQPPHPDHDGSSMSTTAGTPDVIAVGPARTQEEIQTKLDRYVDELDGAISPSIDFVPRENRCDLIVFRATRAALEREVC